MSDIDENFKELIKKAQDLGQDVGKNIRESHPEIVRGTRNYIICEMPGVIKDTIEIKNVDNSKDLKLLLGKNSDGTVYLGKIRYSEEIHIEEEDITVNNGVVEIYID